MVQQLLLECLNETIIKILMDLKLLREQSIQSSII